MKNIVTKIVRESKMSNSYELGDARNWQKIMKIYCCIESSIKNVVNV